MYMPPIVNHERVINDYTREIKSKALTYVRTGFMPSGLDDYTINQILFEAGRIRESYEQRMRQWHIDNRRYETWLSNRDATSLAANPPSPGGTRRSPSGTRRSPGGTRTSPRGTRRSPGGTRRSPGRTRRSPQV